MSRHNTDHLNRPIRRNVSPCVLSNFAEKLRLLEDGFHVVHLTNLNVAPISCYSRPGRTRRGLNARLDSRPVVVVVHEHLSPPATRRGIFSPPPYGITSY